MVSYRIQETREIESRVVVFSFRGFLILVNFTAHSLHTRTHFFFSITAHFLVVCFICTSTRAQKIELNYICQMTWLIMCVFVYDCVGDVMIAGWISCFFVVIVHTEKFIWLYKSSTCIQQANNENRYFINLMKFYWKYSGTKANTRKLLLDVVSAV